jgi:hypothetical protein
MDNIRRPDINLARNINQAPESPKEEKEPGAGEEGRFPKKIKKIIQIGGVIVFLAALAAAGYYYKEASDLKNNPLKQQAVLDGDIKDLVAKVSRLIILPEGEEPTIATVSDPEKLKNQPFFAKAKTGDKVLIYSQAKKAILYNPESDKIVEVAPLNINMEGASQ